MCFHFLYIVQVDTVYQNILYNSGLFLFICHGIQKTKEHIPHKRGFIVFYSNKKKKNLYNKENETSLILFIIQKLFF